MPKYGAGRAHTRSCTITTGTYCGFTDTQSRSNTTGTCCRFTDTQSRSNTTGTCCRFTDTWSCTNTTGTCCGFTETRSRANTTGTCCEFKVPRSRTNTTGTCSGLPDTRSFLCWSKEDVQVAGKTLFPNTSAATDQRSWRTQRSPFRSRPTLSRTHTERRVYSSRTS